MGLTLVLGPAKIHHGSVQPLSEGEGAGSEYVVELPLTTLPPTHETTRQPRPTRDESMASNRFRVLIVEDNADTRALLSTLLRMDGHEVTIAKDGETGLAAILQQQPDVALVDIGLPHMTGYEIARRVRASVPAIPTRLIAITGYGQPRDVQKSLEAGFDEHLTKPVEMEAVSRLLSGGIESD